MIHFLTSIKKPQFVLRNSLTAGFGGMLNFSIDRMHITGVHLHYNYYHRRTNLKNVSSRRLTVYFYAEYDEISGQGYGKLLKLRQAL